MAVLANVRRAEVLASGSARAEQRGQLRAWVTTQRWSLEPASPDGARGVIDGGFDINLRRSDGAREAPRPLSLRHVGAGSIVNPVLDPRRAGFPGYGAYDTAKGGIEALTRTSAWSTATGSILGARTGCTDVADVPYNVRFAWARIRGRRHLLPRGGRRASPDAARI